jgi:hypothetical protein
MENLVNSAIRITHDVNNAGLAMDDPRCMADISNGVTLVVVFMKDLSDLIALGSALDESLINIIIAEAVKRDIIYLDIARDSVNRSTGRCSSNTLVITKAEDVLQLFTEIQTELQLISQRG